LANARLAHALVALLLNALNLVLVIRALPFHLKDVLNRR